MLHKHLMQTIAVMLAAGSATAYGQDLPAPSFRMEPARTAPLELRTPVQQGETTARGDTTSYPVIATQTGANVLEVKNFLGYGQTVKLLMNRNHTYTCRSQVGLVEGNTAYYTRGDLVLNDKGAPESWSETFSFAEGGDPKVVQFGNMSLFYGKSY